MILENDTLSVAPLSVGYHDDDEHPRRNDEMSPGPNRLVFDLNDTSTRRWDLFVRFIGDQNGRTSYHIFHTRDVRSGDVFRRTDRFLELVPIVQSIHMGAFATELRGVQIRMTASSERSQFVDYAVGGRL